MVLLSLRRPTLVRFISVSDSTGPNFGGAGEWLAEKHGPRSLSAVLGVSCMGEAWPSSYVTSLLITAT